MYVASSLLFTVKVTTWIPYHPGGERILLKVCRCIELPAGAAFSQPLPPTHNAFVYVYRGELDVAGTAVATQRMAILANDGDAVAVRARAPSRVLLIAGEPLGEPIAQYGPFVMNTQDELVQAVRDYQSGAFAA